jgi:hypothetical protein
VLPYKPGIAPTLFDTTNTLRMLQNPCEPILICDKMIPASKPLNYDPIGLYLCNDQEVNNKFLYALIDDWNVSDG